MTMNVTWAKELSGEEADEFERFVAAAPSGHFSQTHSWARITSAAYPLAPRYFLVRERAQLVGAAVVLRPSVLGLVGPVAWVERGPICDDAERLPAVVDALISAARRRGNVYLRVMPYLSDGDVAVTHRALAAAGFRNTQKAGATHETTLRVDLRGMGDDPLEALPVKVRREARRAVKAGASVRRGGPADVATLELLHREMMGGQGRGTNNRAWYRALASEMRDAPHRYALFVTEHEGRALNATFVVRHGRQATFVMGASSAESLPYPKTLPSLVEAVRWAHAEGCAIFDLGGVPKEGDTDPKRLAIARFKSDFSKTRVPLVQEHARWLLW